MGALQAAFAQHAMADIKYNFTDANGARYAVLNGFRCYAPREPGCSPDDSDKVKATKLVSAVASQDVELAQDALNAGADPNMKLYGGNNVSVLPGGFWGDYGKTL